MADNPYAIVRCGEVRVDGVLVAALGPNGESCERAPGHPAVHTAATKDHAGTICWSVDGTKHGRMVWSTEHCRYVPTESA